MEDRLLYALAHTPTLTLKQKWQLIQADPTLTFHNSKQSPFSPLISSITTFQRFQDQFSYDVIQSTYKKQGITVISFLHPLYPVSLLEAFYPPLLLYVKGDSSLLKENMISIIGSRKGDEEGRRIVETILPDLIHHGYCIVSGGAKGVDTFAHETTLRYDGKTIAVLAGGFHYMYPKENAALFHAISKNSLLVTEHPPATPVQKWHFPERNRLIASLGQGVVVIQSEKESGTMITVKHALEQGKEVFTTPGSWANKLSKGPQALVRDGAVFVTCAQDILEEIENKPFTNITSFV